MTQNINQVIDWNYYPSEIPQIKNTNLRNRPIGIEMMGLANVFTMLDLPWTSSEARKLNEIIFETMYFAAVSESVELAKDDGPYETFEGSPVSEGLFQFDLWDADAPTPRGQATDRYDWEELRTEMVKHGLRNSLLIALMLTASSASILGNNECFEPYTQHVYTRTVLSGQFVIINEHLVKDLQSERPLEYGGRKELVGEQRCDRQSLRRRVGRRSSREVEVSQAKVYDCIRDPAEGPAQHGSRSWEVRVPHAVFQLLDGRSHLQEAKCFPFPWLEEWGKDFDKRYLPKLDNLCAKVCRRKVAFSSQRTLVGY